MGECSGCARELNSEAHSARCWVLFLDVLAEEVTLSEHAEDVLEGEVGFLDVPGGGGGDDDVVVAEVSHLAAG